jgi:hypothetical protein
MALPMGARMVGVMFRAIVVGYDGPGSAEAGAALAPKAAAAASA